MNSRRVANHKSLRWLVAWIPACMMLAFCGVEASAQSSPPDSMDHSVVGTAIDRGLVQEPTSQSVVPQRDIMDVLNKWLFGKRVEPKLEGVRSGLSWSILPTLSYNPVFGFAFGASASGAGQFGTGPRARPSAISLSANYSTQGQTQVLVRVETTSASSNYLTQADLRYLDTDRSTWGLGPISTGREEYPMHYELLRAYARVYRRASGPVYVGLGYHLDHFTNIVDKRAATGEITPFIEYSGMGVTSTKASGVSINLLADTRNSIVNPTGGYYLSGSIRNYMSDIGSDRNWQEFCVAVQLYPRLPVHSENVLAFWIYNWFTFGPGPYYNLPATGWDTYGRGARGYLQGRIRAANQMYVESEYRFQLTRDGLFGGVVFLNGVSSAQPQTKTFAPMDLAGGFGIRLKFNKYSRTNLALDRAWGRSGSGGWFMAMSEAF